VEWDPKPIHICNKLIPEIWADTTDKGGMSAQTNQRKARIR
jgi:hypothetical protein